VTRQGKMLLVKTPNHQQGKVDRRSLCGCWSYIKCEISTWHETRAVLFDVGTTVLQKQTVNQQYETAIKKMQVNAGSVYK